MCLDYLEKLKDIYSNSSRSLYITLHALSSWFKRKKKNHTLQVKAHFRKVSTKYESAPVLLPRVFILQSPACMSGSSVKDMTLENRGPD